MKPKWIGSEIKKFNGGMHHFFTTDYDYVIDTAGIIANTLLLCYDNNTNIDTGKLHEHFERYKTGMQALRKIFDYIFTLIDIVGTPLRIVEKPGYDWMPLYYHADIIHLLGKFKLLKGTLENFEITNHFVFKLLADTYNRHFPAPKIQGAGDISQLTEEQWKVLFNGVIIPPPGFVNPILATPYGEMYLYLKRHKEDLIRLFAAPPLYISLI